MLDAELLSFVRSTIRSTWTLELLLLMRAHPERAFRIEEAVLELRATLTLITSCLKQLEDAGVVASENGRFRYAPATPALEELCAKLAQAYQERPITIINTIMALPNDRLRNFADAFRFNKKDE